MGRCEGLSDAQGQVMEPLLPREPEKRSRGYSTCALAAHL